MYGRGANSIAEQIGSTYEEAQKIVDDFYTGFPKVKQWMDDTESSAKKNGYVEDFWGRRRRLPDINLPKYTIKSKLSSSEFNPLLGSKGLCSNENSTLIKSYQESLKSIKSRKDYEKIKNDALAKGIYITDNGGFIAQAQRQCVNARVQGGAASMTKIAMRKIFDDEELKQLGFRIVLQIHDELIGECPKENAERCMNKLSEVMKNSVSDKINVPFKCDGYIVNRWYEDDYSDILKEEYESLCKEKTPNESRDILLEEHSELNLDQLNYFLSR